MKQFLMSMGLATLLIPMTTSASMINIGGAAKAFFPTQNVNMTLISEKIKHINYFDEKSMLTYSAYVFTDHGQTPSIRWFESFVKGQNNSVQNGKTRVLHSSKEGLEVIGKFSLTGTLQGVGIEKVCQFLMTSRDYGTWCITTLGKYSDKKVAIDHFLNYADSFELLRD